MTSPLVDIVGIHQRFGPTTVLQDISLSVARGSYTVLLGPSGSGKTTLLSILGGFLVPTEGKVFISGEDCTRVPPAKRPTTTVFQDYALFPHMSVAGNVGFGLRMRGVGRAERDRRAREALAIVGLSEAFGRRPHQLSGGQRQRVALARALVVEPAVLLLDEPLGALDLKLRRQMQDELKAIQKRVGTAFVHVTHDQEEAMALADHCIVMNQGRIEDEGSPERVYSRPATRFSATFMGESTLLPADLTTALPGFPDPGPSGALAIRPEKLLLDRQSGAIPLGEARISSVTFQGSFQRVLAESATIPGLTFIARTGPETPVEVGATCAPSCRPEDMILLTR
jgi:spermidine/putrescine transport system ATP-binding protein